MPNDSSQESIQFDPGAECGPIWEAFTSEPGLAVALIRADGVFMYANQALAGFLGQTSEHVVGRRLEGLLPEFTAREIHGVVRRVLRTDDRVLRRVIWGGRCFQVTYRAFRHERSGGDHVLLTARKGYDEPDGAEPAAAGYVELGPLDVLSTRELEVLALLGEGLRLREIAGQLNRSPKTVDSHIRAIRRKLETTDRAVLMRIAIEAGLDRSVVNKTRVRAVAPDQTHRRARGDSVRPSGS